MFLFRFLGFRTRGPRPAKVYPRDSIPPGLSSHLMRDIGIEPLPAHIRLHIPMASRW